MGWYSEHRRHKLDWEADEAERKKRQLEEQKLLEQQKQQQDQDGKP